MKEILSLFFFLFLIACNNTPPKQQNPEEGQYDAMATQLCTCWKPIADVTAKVEELKKAKDKEGYLKLLDETEDFENDLDDCIEKVEKQHGEITDEREEVKLMTAMKRLCPKVAAVIEAEDAELY